MALDLPIAVAGTGSQAPASSAAAKSSTLRRSDRLLSLPKLKGSQSATSPCSSTGPTPRTPARGGRRHTNAVAVAPPKSPTASPPATTTQARRSGRCSSMPSLLRPIDAEDAAMNSSRSSLWGARSTANGEEDVENNPLRRSTKLLGALETLRHTKPTRTRSKSPRPKEADGDGASPTTEGGDSPTIAVEDEEEEEQAEQDASYKSFKEEHEILMYQTLKSLTDTVAEKSEVEDKLASGVNPVKDLGGARHPTTVISCRTLSIVRRKKALLQKMEDRIAGVEAAIASRDDLQAYLMRTDGPILLEDVLAAAPEEHRPAFAALKNVKGFINSLIHRDRDGVIQEPCDADKSPFDSFVASFGLPQNHEGLVKLRDLANQVFDWWATQALACAERTDPEVDIDAIKRQVELAAAILYSKDHEAIAEAESIISARACRRCELRARAIYLREDAVTTGQEAPPPSDAKRCAEAIEAELKTATDMFDADPMDKFMQEAKRLSHVMFSEEKSRHAKRALMFARSHEERDRKEEQKVKDRLGPSACQEVGPASELADQIDAEVERAKGQGAPADHKALAEAIEISKGLRNTDGFRKRMKGRESRLASKASAERAASKASAERAASKASAGSARVVVGA